MSSILNNGMETIEASELIGREVVIASEDYDEIVGVLHSLSDHGVLVKEKNEYVLIPWRRIKSVVHTTKKKVPDDIGKTGAGHKNDTDIVVELSDRTKLILIGDTCVSELAQVVNRDEDDFSYALGDDGDSFILEDEDGDEVVEVTSSPYVMTVYQERFFKACLGIAKEFKVKKIIKDFQS